MGTGTKPVLVEAPPTVTNSTRRRIATTIVVCVVLLAASVIAARISRHESVQDLALATVRSADFVRILRVHGTVETVRFSSVIAPRLAGSNVGQLIVTKLAHNGSTVHKGDLLVEFDRQAQTKDALDRDAEYKDLLQQIEKKKADQAAQLAADRTEIVVAENALRTAKLEVRKNEIVSQIDAEKNQQAVEEATAALDQLKETFELKRQAALAGLKVLEIQRDRALNALLHARGNSEKLTIRAPLDGIVVVNSTWKGNQRSEIQEGDQVWPGTPIMRLVDPSYMQVRARVNQADVGAVRSGLNVSVSLDAYPGLKFPGKVEEVASVGRTSGLNDKVRVYPVLFSINGNDQRLMPDLSTAVDIELERTANVLLVPRETLVAEESGWFVYRKGRLSTEKVKVEIGALSDTEVTIKSGLSVGDVVVRNPQRNGGKP